MSVAEILRELPKLSAKEREAVEQKLGEIRARLRPASAGLQDALANLRKDSPTGVQENPASWQGRIREDRHP